MGHGSGILTSIRPGGYNPHCTPQGPVAQLGARINRTDEVAGSNPARSTRFLGPMAQLGARLNGIEEVVGSNPTGSTYN
jgi:hypothetical protein